MGYIHFITGGERSGKSAFAEKCALAASARPIYMATARIWDDEFRNRVKIHQDRRGPEWENIEEEKYPSHHSIEGRVVLIDCVTLWATNYFYDNEGEVEPALSMLKDEVDRLLPINSHLIIVSNEIGSGGISLDPVQRKFTSLQGWINQYIANLANRVTLMVSGIPLTIK